MVELKPEIKQIGPNLTEISWPTQMVGELLFKRIQIEKAIQKEFCNYIIETRAGYQSISIVWKKKPEMEQLSMFLNQVQEDSIQLDFNLWEIPVCYDQILGKDLYAYSKAKSFSIEDIINLHSESNYQLNFYGFLPGFMYLSGLNPLLAHPRKSVPDRSIDAGSVAIGGNLTGIYPQNSPGGWHVIGKTPTPFFNPYCDPPVWAKPGDQIRFTPISMAEYERMSAHPKFPKVV
ncbi:5-oxoprolinase subunit B family protein [Algoriphagus zhangzhouensis]|uniref:Inhibitor of KinA n=1 Tax=Algoriphagus zhangzhouensis TaxID=1073327 RepID=A0A1M7Z438_9BACT|nr:carboxyltransferase domain-containing protein [Algoriphagus zhangzhouensis]TDY48492.1 inhibitor of KinA [Algoriphagus zhangzhouensis]SHO59540.1 inhibitor of KinA [Algoriphagus zhangzhouensis]